MENHQGGGVSELLQYGRNHQQAEAQRVSGDDREGNLPGESHADEPVVKIGMGDERRRLAADEAEKEIQGNDGYKSPDSSAPEDNFCESQGASFQMWSDRWSRFPGRNYDCVSPGSTRTQLNFLKQTSRLLV